MRLSLSPGFVCLLLLIGGAFYERPTIQRLLTEARAPGHPAPRTPQSRGYAPEGTFYLRQYVAARTARGIYGFEPGCEVKLLKVADDRQTMTVSDGRQTINVRRALLTNNLDVADAVRDADQMAQAAIFDEQMRRRLAYDASHRDVFIAHAESVHAAELVRVRDAAIGGAHGVLDAPAQPVGTDGDGNSLFDAPGGNPRSLDDDDTLYSAVNGLSTSTRGMLSGTR